MSATPPWAPSDPLAEALHPLRMRGTFYCRSELTEPWTLEIPAFPDTVSFHVVADGSCELHVAGKPTTELQRGDRSEEHTSELQSRGHLVCRLLLEKKKQVNLT